MNTNGVNKEAANYDEHLRFELPEGYEIERGTNDKGGPTFFINYGVTIDDEGRKKSRETYVISKIPIDINDVESNINCNYAAVVRGGVQDINFLSYNMKAIIGIVFIIFEDTCYSVQSTTASKAERVLLKTEGLANNLTKIVNCMVIDGTKVTMDPIPVSLIFEEEDYSEFRKTDPSDKQHTHLDFLSSTKGALGFLGALSVNQNGTEYAFYPVSDLDLDPMAEVILDKYSVTDFELAETAYKMSELFRVRLEAFNQSHDREQEIKKGLIHKVALYESFRSFAWTLSAYCAGKGVKPADVSYEILCKMCRFIESRKGLNYTDWAFSPAICSGDDIHIYYLPAMSSEDNKSIAKYLQVKEEAGKCQNIVSLDALRSELTYLYPAVETIYNSLRAERDDGEPLEGGVADVLYVWCAMTYAARQPIYSEDGPMNCSFSHPGEMDQIPAEYRRMMEEL